MQENHDKIDRKWAEEFTPIGRDALEFDEWRRAATFYSPDFYKTVDLGRLEESLLKAEIGQEDIRNFSSVQNRFPGGEQFE